MNKNFKRKKYNIEAGSIKFFMATQRKLFQCLWYERQYVVDVVVLGSNTRTGRHIDGFVSSNVDDISEGKENIN